MAIVVSVEQSLLTSLRSPYQIANMTALANESFVVCISRCEVEVVQNILEESQQSRHGNLITLQPGFLAKVKDTRRAGGSQKTTTAIIRIYDFYNRNFVFENNLFACSRTHLQVVAPPLWPFLIGIKDPLTRIGFFRDHESVAYLLSLNCDDLVIVNGASVNCPSPSFLTCIVRYIGLVSEIGPGFYLALEVTVIGWHLFRTCF